MPIQSLTGKEVDSSRWFRYEGKLVSNFVCVTKPGDMNMLYKMGFFGKGMLSKSKPGRDEQLRIFQKKRKRLPDDVRRLILTDIRSRNCVRRKRRREWTEMSGITMPQEEDAVQVDAIPSDASVSDEEQIGMRTPETVHDDMSGNTSCKKEDQTSHIFSEFRELPDTITGTRVEGTDDKDKSNVSLSVSTPFMQLQTGNSTGKGEDVQIQNTVSCRTELEVDTTSAKSNCDSSFKMQRGQMDEVTKLESVKLESVKLESKPKEKSSEYPVTEFLQLSLCEAFFLSYGLGCLTVHRSDGSPLTITQLWQACLQAQPGFLALYVAYHHLRSKGWVVRTGEKYGVDFLIYKDGPMFHHSNAAILVQTVDKDTLQPVYDPAIPSIPFTWQYLAGINRINGAVGKDLILFHVLKPSGLTDDDLSSPVCIRQMSVQEIVLRRWIPDRSREVHDHSNNQAETSLE